MKEKKLYMTDAARYSAIENIKQLIHELTYVAISELSWTSNREIVEYLRRYEELIKDEIQYK